MGTYYTKFGTGSHGGNSSGNTSMQGNNVCLLMQLKKKKSAQGEDIALMWVSLRMSFHTWIFSKQKTHQRNQDKINPRNTQNNVQLFIVLSTLCQLNFTILNVVLLWDRLLFSLDLPRLSVCLVTYLMLLLLNRMCLYLISFRLKGQ